MTKLLDNMKTMRRNFHQMAEPGWLEFETSIRIINYLKDLGYEISYGKDIHSTRMGLPSQEEMDSHAKSLTLKDPGYDISEILEGYTGAVARMDTEKEGPTIALRFDIDANDIMESRDRDHRPYREGFASKNDGAMHACGHDAHATIGLYTAKWIVDNIDDLRGKFLLIFQPAEEGVRGAKSMVEKDLLKGVDYMLAGHIGVGLPSNTIGLGDYGYLATSKYDIRFKGLASHAGGSPEEGKNALLGAAFASLALHTASQFSQGMSRVNVGKIQAGSGRNIVPAHALLNMEIRGENEDIHSMLKERVKDIVKGSATMYDLDYEIEEVGGAPAYSKVDKEFVGGFEKYLQDKEKDYELIMYSKASGSEDVTYMMNYVEDRGGRAIHMIYGSDLAAGHHNEYFDIDESSLLNGLDITTECIKYIINEFDKYIIN